MDCGESTVDSSSCGVVSGALLGAIAVVVFLAGVIQRVSGIGYALVVSPVLLVVVGPDEAVRVVTITSIASSAATLAATWRSCRPREIAVLIPFAFLALWPAGALAVVIGEGAGSLVSGAVVVLALGLALRPGPIEAVPRWASAAAAGALSGAMNAFAALGGPTAAAYGLSRQWGTALVPNVQVFLLLSAVGVLSVRGWPQQTTGLSLGILATVAGAGVLAGGWLDSHPVAGRARLLTVWVAAVGAALAIGRGVAVLM